jgi:hypothetical protein
VRSQLWLCGGVGSNIELSPRARKASHWSAPGIVQLADAIAHKNVLLCRGKAPNPDAVTQIANGLSTTTFFLRCRRQPHAENGGRHDHNIRLGLRQPADRARRRRCDDNWLWALRLGVAGTIPLWGLTGEIGVQADLQGVEYYYGAGMAGGGGFSVGPQLTTADLSHQYSISTAAFAQGGAGISVEMSKGMTYFPYSKRKPEPYRKPHLGSLRLN